jgi:nitroimidazol reductase NimA-like FMN-containing flavoprotein (pyridoxamine 5'-phosphate oxidase superfamily)
MDTVHRILQLNRQECLELLGSVDLGRVVFTDQALPAILPVTFTVDDDSVVLRTARGSRLARAAQGAVLAFEVDQVDVASRLGWSVVVTGEALIETDPAQQARLGTRLQAWVPGPKDVFIRIPLSVVSGRRIQGLPLAAPNGVPPQPR